MMEVLMKTLCLYYSRTNLTKEVMESMAQVLDADLAEYTDGKDRSGFLGYVGHASRLSGVHCPTYPSGERST